LLLASACSVAASLSNCFRALSVPFPTKASKLHIRFNAHDWTLLPLCASPQKSVVSYWFSPPVQNTKTLLTPSSLVLFLLQVRNAPLLLLCPSLSSRALFPVMHTSLGDSPGTLPPSRLRAASHPTVTTVMASSSSSSFSSTTASPSRTTTHYHVWTSGEFRQFVAVINGIASRGERFSRAHASIQQLATHLFGDQYDHTTALRIIHNKWTNASKASSQQFDACSDEELATWVCAARKHEWRTSAAAMTTTTISSADTTDSDATDSDNDTAYHTPRRRRRQAQHQRKQPPQQSKTKTLDATATQDKQGALRMWAWIGQQMKPPRIWKLCERRWAAIQDQRNLMTALQRSAARARSYESEEPVVSIVSLERIQSDDDVDMCDIVSSLAHLGERPVGRMSPLPYSTSSSVLALETAVMCQLESLTATKTDGHDVYYLYRFTSSVLDQMMALLKTIFPVLSAEDRDATHTILQKFRQQCCSLFDSFWWRCEIDTQLAIGIASLHSEVWTKWGLLFQHLATIPAVAAVSPRLTAASTPAASDVSLLAASLCAMHTQS
jgi:hypothetical protein